jgi:hypothetical protein
VSDNHVDELVEIGKMHGICYITRRGYIYSAEDTWWICILLKCMSCISACWAWCIRKRQPV